MSSLLNIKDRLFYGWVVVIVGLIVAIIIAGTMYSFGVFFKPLESEFGLPRAAISGVYSISLLLGCLLGALWGWALDRHGSRVTTLLIGLFAGLGLLVSSQITSIWQLYLSYGLLYAIGAGGVWPIIMAVPSKWFRRKRGLALGVVGAGGGLGALIIAPFATYLISVLNWQTTFVVLGLITWAVVIPLSRLFKREPSEIGALPNGAKSHSGGMEGQDKEAGTELAGLSLKQASKTRSFWFLLASAFLFAMCFCLMQVHMVPHTTDMGILDMEAARLLGVMLLTFPGRVVMGIVSDRMGRKRVALACSLAIAAVLLLLIWSKDLWMLYLFAVVYAFAAGGFDVCVWAMVGDIFGLRHIGVLMGAMIAVSWGVGGAIGPVVGGFIFDVSNSYSLAFAIAAAAMLVAASLMASVRTETNI